MRVELSDSDGNRYTVAFEGQITREKVLRLMDLVELLGGAPNESETSGPATTLATESHSKFDKVRIVTTKCFPLVWFTSREAQLAYEQEFKEPIGLSTAATYLSRLASKGMLMRTGPPNNLKYKLAQNALKHIIP
jgi:hypothetical protein